MERRGGRARPAAAIDFRPILFVVGAMLATLAVAMGIPAVADVVAGHPEWRVFAGSAAATLFFGVALVLTNRTERIRLTLRQTFVLTTLSWVTVAVFAALPFAFTDLGLSPTDAFFEAMSGITTTGSTVIGDLDRARPGILLWRALLQWLGGIGIIAMAIAALPFLRVGGMQLFRRESSEVSERFLPRLAQIVTGIVVIYVGLSAACAMAYWTAGLSGFDAITHAMATISTGGFSTRDGSIGAFESAAVDWIATAFMAASALPFVLYLQLVRGDPAPLYRDTQVRWFLGIAASVVLVVALWLMQTRGVEAGDALRYAAFNVISIMTTSGYATADYGQWGSFAVTVFLVLMFVGGCTGSTVGSLKVFRYQILYETMRVQVARLIQPHGVFIAHFNRQPIPEKVVESVLSFIYLYGLAFVLLAIALGALGLDFLTAVSGAATALGNIGPGLGRVIGPAGNFAPLPDAAKWLLSAGMLLGRLELFTVLVLFAPSFWRD